MAQIYAPESLTNKNGHSMIGMCVTGDLHELGAHMLCDLFEMEGWDTTYLGANVPIGSAVRMVRARKADLVAISAAMPYHLSAVAEMIRAIREVEEFARGKIIVGGNAFRVRDVWKRVGADGHARDAAEAIKVATRLVA
jgi:methanogenic corrinoid protein MtbC1